MNRRMRVVTFVLLLLFGSAAVVGAQGNHFVYFQTENNQPFYLRLDGQLHSSTASGYLILSKLNSGSYQIFIGFPKNEFPEEGFQFDLEDRNDGYFIIPSSGGTDIQNIETKKWLTKISGTPQPRQQSATEDVAGKVNQIQEKDGFSELLGSVVKDQSIGSNPPPREKADVEAENINTERPAAPGAAPIETPQNGEVITGGTEDSGVSTSNSASTKLFSDLSDEGEEMVYLDKKTNDTVRILVPYLDDTIELPQGTDMTPLIKETPAPPKEENIVPDEKEAAEDPKVAEPEQPVEKKTPAKEENVAHAPNKSTCTTPANQDDFLKLRKAIAGESDMDVMIEVVTKTYNGRCFTTEQTKNLTYLFLTDEGRYRFLDATYDLVSDPENFASLVSTLEDSYYIRRFRAMIR